MLKKDVINITGGVQTETGRTLYGLDAEIYERMKNKEDPEWERKVGEYIEDVIGHPIQNTMDLWVSLKSGVVLVELINKIQPGIIKKYNNKETLHVLMERENITLYLEGCWKLGISNADMFTVPDLHSRANMASVFNNIAALSSIAPGIGYVKLPGLRAGAFLSPPSSPREEGASRASVRIKKQWTVGSNQGPVYAEELKGDEDPVFLLAQTQKQLSSAQSKINLLQNSNQQLLKDLQTVRSTLRELKNNTQVIDEVVTETKTNQEPDTLPVAVKRRTTTDQNAKEIDSSIQIENLKKTNFELTNEYNLLKRKIQDMEAQRENEQKQSETVAPTLDNLTLEELKALYIQEHTEKLRLKELNFVLKQNNQQLEKSFDALKTEHFLEFELKVVLRKIFDRNVVVEPDSLSHFTHFFAKDENVRHYFAEFVRNEILKENTNYVHIRSTSFASLCLLINSTLENLNPSNGGDFILAKFLLQSSFLICKKIGTVSWEYVQAHLKNHAFWKNMQFWEEYFWEKTSRNCPHQLLGKAEMISWLKNELKNFSISMVGWGNLSTSEILDFYCNLFKHLDPEHPDIDKTELKKLSEAMDKQKEYKKSSTGLNFWNFIGGVNVETAELPLKDLKTDAQPTLSRAKSNPRLTQEPQAQRLSSSTTRQPQPAPRLGQHTPGSPKKGF